MINVKSLLEEKRANHLYRKRNVIMRKNHNKVIRDNKNVISFCSNDYLGLSQHPEIIRAFKKAAEQWGVGSTSSQLIGGHTKYHNELEQRLANFFNQERALLFSTGYMANLGVLSTLIEKKDRIFADKYCHASIIDGIQHSGAEFKRYRHNDVLQLEKMLDLPCSGQKWIVTEGVFSMEGDIASLDKIIKLKNKFQAKIILDDAHGIGVMGKTGRGTLEYLNINPNEIDLLVGTFGKAFGGSGAFVVGDHDLIEYLIQCSRTLIYTTSMPPAMAGAMIKSLSLIEKENERREKLHKMIGHFRKKALNYQLKLMDSPSPIQPIMIGCDKKVMETGKGLFEKGFWVGTIRPPTVPKGTARLRVGLNTEHTEKQVDQLLQAIIDVEEN